MAAIAGLRVALVCWLGGALVVGCGTAVDEPSPMAAGVERVATKSDLLKKEDCDTSLSNPSRPLAYDGIKSALWKYCPDGYGTTVPFAAPSAVVASPPPLPPGVTLVEDQTIPEDPATGRPASYSFDDPAGRGLPNYFPMDYDIPTTNEDKALQNCEQFDWFTSSPRDAVPPNQDTITSGKVCLGLGGNIDAWLGKARPGGTALTGHEHDCRRLWMFDKRYWPADDARSTDAEYTDPTGRDVFQPWDPFDHPPGPDEVLVPPPVKPATVPYKKFHGYSYCRNKFFVWCVLHGKKGHVAPEGVIWTSSRAPVSPPPWSNDKPIEMSRFGLPVVTGSEMCTFYQETGRLPRRSVPSMVNIVTGTVATPACGGAGI